MNERQTRPTGGDEPGRPSGASGTGRDSTDLIPAQTLIGSIRALVRRFSVSERADVACCGVTVAQAAALETLRLEGPTRLGPLGRRLGITPSTLTRNVDRLERAGLVTRLADPADGRAFRLSLTPAGREAAAALERQEEGFAQSVLNRLPASRRRAVVQALGDLLVAVRGATEECCPGAYDHLMTGFPRATARGKGGNDETQGCREDCR